MVARETKRVIPLPQTRTARLFLLESFMENGIWVEEQRVSYEWSIG
jgi:hypothetical protein